LALISLFYKDKVAEALTIGAISIFRFQHDHQTPFINNSKSYSSFIILSSDRLKINNSGKYC